MSGGLRRGFFDRGIFGLLTFNCSCRQFHFFAHLQPSGYIRFDLTAHLDVAPLDETLGLRPCEPITNLENRRQRLSILAAIENKLNRAHNWFTRRARTL